MDELIAEFLAETNEALADLDTALVELERSGDDPAAIARIFRMIHSVKGAAGFLGLERLATVTHAAEELLGSYRDGELSVSAAGISAILATLDLVRTILNALATQGCEPSGDDAALLAALVAEQQSGPPKAAASAPPDDAPQDDPATDEAGADEQVQGNDVKAHPTEPSSAAVQAGPASAAPRLPVQAIRVSLDVLDDLMTLASELVLVRNQLLQVARGQEASPFSAPLSRLSRITSDLQEGVMKTRMQPVSAAWGALPRIVRDLGAELGKRIDLVMTGGETELDRQVLELIRDPLTHMVRNSCDHGLETPEVRRAAGKREIGCLSLSARQEGGRIVIELSDDGRGLDLVRVRARALERGLATEAELAVMRDEEIANFVFRPGFSTAEVVTTVSGRGVGMDVVRSNIERIGGSVKLRTEPGRGTTVSIRIPLTLAIVSGLVVSAAGERFAVPQSAVMELVRVGRDAANVEWIDAAPVMRLRGTLLPLAPLGTLLGLAPPTDARVPVEGFVAVLRSDSGRFGLLVDSIFDTEEIVVKPVAPILRDLSAFSGNTILGDGGVIMILDPAGVARLAGLRATAADVPAQHMAEASTDASQQLLVFRIAGAEAPVGVPLGLVARLEQLPAASIETAGGRPVAQYRGCLMPLVPLAPWTRPAPGTSQPVLVFQDGERRLGLVVEEILDVLDDAVELRPSAERPGYLGSAVVAGRATDILDCAHWLRIGEPTWFGRAATAPPRLLVVEDSSFFRQVVVPALTSAGYDVTARPDADSALRLRADGVTFDVVLSDIEMPGMDGFGLLAEIRREGPWRDIPVVALTSKSRPVDIARGMAAGFADYVPKFDRDRVLDALSRATAQRETA
jgi:two-component system chemotaxis sensor kinase CheA